MSSSIALIAGNGTLPLEVGRTISESGRKLLTIAIKDEAIPAMDELANHWLGWGQLGKMFKILKENECHEVVLIGGVSKRPNFQSVLGDLGTLSRLPKIISILVGGDDKVLQGVIQIFETEGFRIVGAHEVAPSLLAGEGTVTRTNPGTESENDAKIAINACKLLGELDIGQSAVVVNGRVIAVEAAEGTDSMLERCISLREKRQLAWSGKCGVLAKFAKPGQDLRVDLPTIGPQTIDLISNAALAGIAVSGNSVLIADRNRTIKLADENGIFIKGF